MTIDELTMAVLGAEARRCAPRLFALYGVNSNKITRDDDGAFIGWGMDFGNSKGAIMWAPGGDLWRSDSAASLLDRRLSMGAAQLIWLSDPPEQDDPGTEW
jgi:hypothetical protein